MSKGSQRVSIVGVKVLKEKDEQRKNARLSWVHAHQPFIFGWSLSVTNLILKYRHASFTSLLLLLLYTRD